MWPLYLHMHVCAHVHVCMHTHTQKLFVIFEEISENKYISLNNYIYVHILRVPHGSAGKESTCNAGDLGSIPGLGKSPGEGKCYPLQYSGLENSMDYIVHGVAKSWTWMGDFHFGASLIAQLVNNPPAMQETQVLLLGSGRSTGEGICYTLQYSWASPVAQLVKNLPAMWEIWVQYLGWEDPLEKGKGAFPFRSGPVFWPGEFRVLDRI